MIQNILQTVVETTEFIKQATNCMDDKTRENFIDFIAKNPLAGDLIQGTGGARVIYYYHDEDMPIFLFTAYKKNQKRKFNSI